MHSYKNVITKVKEFKFGDVCLIIEKTKSFGETPYLFYASQNDETINNTKLWLSLKGYDAIVKAMNENIASLINQLINSGNSTSNSATLLIAELKKMPPTEENIKLIKTSEELLYEEKAKEDATPIGMKL